MGFSPCTPPAIKRMNQAAFSSSIFSPTSTPTYSPAFTSNGTVNCEWSPLIVVAVIVTL